METEKQKSEDYKVVAAKTTKAYLLTIFSKRIEVVVVCNRITGCSIKSKEYDGTRKSENLLIDNTLETGKHRRAYRI